MPQYTFICPKCKIRGEVFAHMDDDPACTCVCGADMVRDYQTDLVNVGGRDYHKAIHSDAMAISPTQVAEHKRLFPDIEIDSQCRPVFDNFTKHEDYMKKCGIVKTPQKIKRSGAKRIA